MRTNIPSFRLPVEVLDAEVDQILDMGLRTKFNSEITSLKEFLKEDFDAVFVGTGASSPKGRKKMTYYFDYYDQNSFSKRKYGFVFWYKARSLKYTPIQMGLTTYSSVCDI